MKKFIMLGTVVALVVVALALPALAGTFRGDNQDQQRLEQRFDRWQDQAQQRDYSQDEAYGYYFDRFAHFYGFGDDNNRWNDRNDNNNWWNDGRNNDNGNNNDTPAVSQSNEQEVQSGDATQNISVTGGGDNSNQCAGVQGINNTGNATTNTSVLQYGNEGAGVEIDDSGNFTISPSQTTTCNQQVNQAASASGR